MDCWLHDSLTEIILKSFHDFINFTALEIGEDSWTYAELLKHASDFIEQNASHIGVDGTIGILPQRKFESFSAILAAVLSGRPYTSLNMKFPLQRQLHIARESRCRFIVADFETQRRHDELIAQLDFPSPALGLDEKPIPSDPSDRHAYYMFTSGTTGQPKGVINTRANLQAYLLGIHSFMNITAGIRFAQFFDLSFDVSVHDLFYTWFTGGTLCVMTPADGTDQVTFAKKRRIQCWYSVPSAITFAERFGKLQPGLLPEVRWAMFAGEALPASQAAKWLEACPNARGFNLYGPTESTITVCGYEFDSAALAANGEPTVPIGSAYAHNEIVLVNEAGSMLTATGAGELWIGGPQNAAGYLNNPQETLQRFVNRTFPGKKSTRWYRTGDLVEYTIAHEYQFRSRIDDQIKIRGYRAELQEIEEALRKASGVIEVAIVPWPMVRPGNADGIVGFVAGAFDTAEVLKRCAEVLPSYMVPDRLIRVDSLELNQNGKVDRKALRIEYLEKSSVGAVKPEEGPTDIERRLISVWTELFPGQSVGHTTSFLALNGDSLTYVSALMAVEQEIGALPEHWQKLTIAELARTAIPENPGYMARVDTPATLRALAITLMLGGHFGYTHGETGATGILMLLSGYFYAAMSFDKIIKGDTFVETFAILRKFFVIYYTLIIPLIFISGYNISYTTIFLMDDLVNSGTEYTWYMHALAHIIFAQAFLIALQKNTKNIFPKIFSSNLTTIFVTIAIGFTFYVVTPLFIPPSESVYVHGAVRLWRYAFFGQMFIFGCGALIGYRTDIRTRSLALTMLGVGAAMSIVLGYVGQGASTWLAAVTIVFATNLRMPRFLARVTYALANAALFIYLLQPPITEWMTRQGLRRSLVLPVVLIAGLGVDWLWNKAPPYYRAWRQGWRQASIAKVQT